MYVYYIIFYEVFKGGEDVITLNYEIHLFVIPLKRGIQYSLVYWILPIAIGRMTINSIS